MRNGKRNISDPIDAAFDAADMLKSRRWRDGEIGCVNVQWRVAA